MHQIFLIAKVAKVCFCNFNHLDADIDVLLALFFDFSTSRHQLMHHMPGLVPSTII
jgi:hypothetical protein